jgi:hypothetical protein
MKNKYITINDIFDIENICSLRFLYCFDKGIVGYREYIGKLTQA